MPGADMSGVQAADASQQPPHGGTLAAWLAWQTQLHSHRIELGLERVREVAARLDVLAPSARSVIVAGTNGKGSCVRLIETLLGQRGHRVGTYTSPHLWRYNERVRMAGSQASDTALCTAFTAVEAARGDVHLTYFEFGTLAALWLFAQAELDFIVLEVGMGGRLDAVNIIDADVALITNIGLDHTAFLGATRAAIGFEKAGVMRSGQPVVCTDRDMPATIAAHAENTGAQLYRIGSAFDLDASGWHGRGQHDVRWQQPLPAHVVADNLAGALAVTALLGEPASSAAAVMAVCKARQALPGRREIVDDGGVRIVYDVGHNDEAIALLVAWLQAQPVAGTTHVIVGMLADKPVATVAARLAPVTDWFYTVDLAELSDRGVDAVTLANQLGHGAESLAAPAAALAVVKARARPGDQIIVCGSFYTVAHARTES